MWYKATILGNYDGCRRNNIMSHNQYIKEFHIPAEQYQLNNIEGWELSEEPTSNEYSVDVERVISAYM